MVKNEDLSFKQTIYSDLSASIAVFLVAIPLCLGIAHASGAPLMSGLITGIIGGIVVGFISKSPLSVSGPAAGLTAIVLAALNDLGSLEAFFLATFLAGIFQVILGVTKSGVISAYIPSSVIRGMLAAIGIIIILKQFPHMIGYDIEKFGSETFALPANEVNAEYSKDYMNESNTFTVFLHSFTHINTGVFVIGMLSILTLIGWDKTLASRFKTVPGSLIAVLLGTVVSILFVKFFPTLALTKDHLVNLPDISGGLGELIRMPDWSQLTNMNVYIVALTIALVASIETLLSIEAVDQIDPLKRKTPQNRELVAQGIGNSLAGLLGGLPMTSVIVRSSVNVSAGGKTNKSTVLHGFFILLSVLFAAQYINMIPLATLAAVLVYTGYKLAHPKNFKEIFAKGNSQFIPYVVTISAVVLTDLLSGVIIGIGFSILMLIKNMLKAPIHLEKGHNSYKLELRETISFFHKPKLMKILETLPENSNLEIQTVNISYIDNDIVEALNKFISEKKIQVINKDEVKEKVNLHV